MFILRRLGALVAMAVFLFTLPRHGYAQFGASVSEDATKKPIRLRIPIDGNPVNVNYKTAYTVPVGKRFVLEHAAMSVQVGQDLVPISGLIGPEPAGITHYHLVPVRVYNAPSNTAEKDRYLASQAMRLYFDAGEKVQVGIFYNRQYIGDPLAVFYLSGYLVDVP